MKINTWFKNNSMFVGVFLLVLLSVTTFKPLLIEGFFPMHDDTQPSRVFEMANALRDGMFPVRWSENLGYGYGYPLFNFYAPFAYYLGGVISLFGVDVLNATKVVMALGFILSGLGMYLLARQFWGELGGIISGAFYLFVPYHALNIYVRGDLAEFWASVWIPFVFWGMWGIYRHKKWRYVIVAALSYAAIITSHNLTALMVTPFVMVFLGLLLYSGRNDKTRIIYLLLSFVVGLLVSAFYWLPVLPEMKYTNVLSQIGGKADYSLHFVCPMQLWDSPWGFGGSAPGCFDGMSYRLGKLHMVVVLLVTAGVFFIKKHRKEFYAIVLSLIGLIITLWLTLEWSKLVWQFAPYMSFFQYPWRFLLMAAFFSSFLAGAGIWILSNLAKKFSYHKYLILGTVGILIFVNYFLYAKLFEPQTILPKTSDDYTSQEALRWTISKISDEYLPKNFEKPQSPDDIVKQKLTSQGGSVSIKEKVIKNHYYSAEISVDSPSVFAFNHAYFPAWKVRLDGKDYNYVITDKAYVFPLLSGNHKFIAEFIETPVEKLANLLSFTGIVVLLAGIIREWNLVSRKRSRY